MKIWRLVDTAGCALLIAALLTGVIPKNTPLSFLLFSWVWSFLIRAVVAVVTQAKQ